MLAIAAIATVQAALTGAPAARTPGFDERRYELWATNLYRLGFYGDTATSKLAKEELRSVPYTAYVPPGYPFMLVTLKELHADDAATRRGVQAALVGLIVLTAGLISLRLFGPLAALLSEAILVATGVLPTYAQLNMSEILFTATLFGSIALAFFGLRRRSWRLLVCSGLLLGYAILVRPQVLLLPVPIAIYIAFVTGRRRRRARALGAVFLVAAYGVVAPWTIRNELRLHAFVPVASYTWLNLWEVNNPRANGHFVRPERTIPDEVRRIRALPEIQQDNEWRRLALSWISAHPSKAAIGWVRDVGLFFSYPDPYIRDWYTLHGWRPPRLDERVIYPLVFIAAVLVLANRRRWDEIWLLVIVAGYFVGFFSVFLPLARYRMPLLPFLAIFAAGVPEMLIGLRAGPRARTEPAAMPDAPTAVLV